MIRVDEIWWCGVDATGLAVWPFLDLKRADVEELLTREKGDWKAQGWRVAKLRVVEVSQ